MTRLVQFNRTDVLVAVTVLAATALTFFKKQRRTIRGLSGPVPLPFFGNVFSIDAKKPWITYTEWATRHGDIFKIRVLRQDIVVVNSEKIAKELLVRRSNIYSDRPYLASRIPYGWSFNIAWEEYGDRWRSHRRIFHQYFRAEAVPNLRPTQLRKARQFLSDILSAPQNLFKHIDRFAAAVIMSVVYDYEVAPDHDHVVETFERSIALAFESLTPEASSIIDAFPFVLSLPKWFPGAVLRRKAEVSKHCAMKMLSEPFEHAMKREAMGGNAPAIALDLIRSIKDTSDPSQIQTFREVCATVCVAGIDTSASATKFFVLVMLQHPEVQARAQREIDAVVGTNRLPNFDDRPNMPYIEAILLEIMRMHAVVPLGLPHATTADDVYEGMFIPKGSTIVANIWAMHHNKDSYPEPHMFRPERFLVDGKHNGEKFSESLSFGFGRRTCPGRFGVNDSFWLTMVFVLSTFKIEKARDERGREIDFQVTYSHGVTTAPNPFPCSITPRQGVDVQKILAMESIE